MLLWRYQQLKCLVRMTQKIETTAFKVKLKVQLVEQVTIDNVPVIQLEQDKCHTALVVRKLTKSLKIDQNKSIRDKARLLKQGKLRY